jgi:hypothetical protein
MSSNEPTQINVAFPEASDKHLKLSVGACRLKMKPGDGAQWVTGTYNDAGNNLPSKIEQQGGTVRITQDYRSFLPFGWLGNVPRFDLALGKAQPYLLTIEIGASENSFDLGGVPITRLAIKQGAGKANFDFSMPNPQPMSLLKVEAGAVGLEMKNLANANFAEMSVDGGAAGYKFDFGGTLQRDAHVKITAGMTGVDVTGPATTAAKIMCETVLGGLNIGDGFTKKDGAFWTEAALKGQTPVLTIEANISLGGLTIKTR